MNTIEFTHPNGFPWTQKTLNFLQEASYNDMKALVALCGCEASKSYILYGCQVSGTSISAGWVVIGNEIYSFAGGSGSAIGIQESRENATYQDETVRGVYISKKAVISATGTPISQFIRLKNIKDLLSGVPAATISEKGVIEIATNDEVYAGTRADLAVTPKSLKDGNYVRDNNYIHTDNNFTNTLKTKLSNIGNASETTPGLVERADTTEGQSGTDNVRFMTSYLTKLLINKLVKSASEAIEGLVKRASNSHADAGTNNALYMTPYLVKRMIDKLVPTASISTSGKVELSTLTEARSGTANKVITADILKVEIDRLISMMTSDNKVLYSGRYYWGDVDTENPEKITFPNVGTTNYVVQINVKSAYTGANMHIDNDLSYATSNYTTTSFDLSFREYAGQTQRITVEYTLIKIG